MCLLAAFVFPVVRQFAPPIGQPKTYLLGLVKLGIHPARTSLEKLNSFIDSHPGGLASQNTLTKLGIHQARASPETTMMHTSSGLQRQRLIKTNKALNQRRKSDETRRVKEGRES
ncbi:MAG: hypothetical protein ABI977_05440 [Acidobacteriota bacterium]